MRTKSSNRWAVLVGVNGYHESLGALNFCTNDAKLMHEMLVSECCAFPVDNIVLLTDDQPKDRQPTFGNIHSWLGTWLSRPAPDDLVLVYFAGHGREANGQALLAPLDATLESLPVTGIPIQYVRDLLDRCRAAQKVLLLDACHSGAGRDVATMTSGFREALDEGKGLYTIASCDANQISYEWPEKKHGVFTHYVVEAIRHGAPMGADGRVSLDRVYETARDGILAWTAGKRLKQEPVRICRTKGDIHIACRPLNLEQQLTAAKDQVRAHQETINKLQEEMACLAEENAALRRENVADEMEPSRVKQAYVRQGEKVGWFRRRKLLCVLAADGKEHVLLDLTNARLRDPRDVALSPDGTRILFLAYDHSSECGLYVICVDGSRLTCLRDTRIHKTLSPARSFRTARWCSCDEVYVSFVDISMLSKHFVYVRLNPQNLPIIDESCEELVKAEDDRIPF